MKKSLAKICLYVVLVGVLCYFFFTFFLYFDVKPSDLTYASSDRVSTLDKPAEVDNARLKVTSDSLGSSNEKGSLIAVFKDFDSIMHSKDGVRYLSMSDSHYSPQERRDLEIAIDALRNTGSLTGGILGDEFKELDQYRSILSQNGIEKIKSMLSFDATDAPFLASSGFKVTGADVGGAYDEASGKFSSIFRLYESQSGGKVEVNEASLKEGGTVLVLVKEALNAEIDGTPAIHEFFSKEGVHKYRFVSNGKHFSISTMGLTSDQALSLANSMLQASRN